MSDKNKKELIEKATGWSLAIFVYGTAIFYFAKHTLNLTGDDLDAYISMLSAGATLFAGFIAIYLFSDWKIQHNKTVISAEAKKLWHTLVILEKETMNLDNLYLSSGQIQSYVFFKSIKSLNEYTKNLIDSYNNSYSELIYFIELAQEKNNEVHSNYYGSIHSYEKEFFDKIESSTTIEDIYDKENHFRDTLIDENKKVRKYLLQYILIK